MIMNIVTETFKDGELYRCLGSEKFPSIRKPDSLLFMLYGKLNWTVFNIQTTGDYLDLLIKQLTEVLGSINLTLNLAFIL